MRFLNKLQWDRYNLSWNGQTMTWFRFYKKPFGDILYSSYAHEGNGNTLIPCDGVNLAVTNHSRRKPGSTAASGLREGGAMCNMGLVLEDLRSYVHRRQP